MGNKFWKSGQHHSRLTWGAVDALRIRQKQCPVPLPNLTHLYNMASAPQGCRNLHAKRHACLSPSSKVSWHNRRRDAGAMKRLGSFPHEAPDRLRGPCTFWRLAYGEHHQHCFMLSCRRRLPMQQADEIYISHEISTPILLPGPVKIEDLSDLWHDLGEDAQGILAKSTRFLGR
jgi:hypothetical protein